jgi:hypothetical protein
MNRIAVAVLIASGISMGSAQAAQEGLVNVKVGNVSALNDIGIAEGTSIQVPIGIAAQVCPDVDANVLAKQKDGSAIDCTVTQDMANEAFINFAKNHKTTQ